MRKATRHVGLQIYYGPRGSTVVTISADTGRPTVERTFNTPQAAEYWISRHGGATVTAVLETALKYGRSAPFRIRIPQ